MAFRVWGALALFCLAVVAAQAQERNIVQNGALPWNFQDMSWHGSTSYQQGISDGSTCAVAYTMAWGAWSAMAKKNSGNCYGFRSCNGQLLVLELGPGSNLNELTVGVFGKTGGGQGQEYKKRMNELQSTVASNSHVIVAINLSELSAWATWDRVFIQNYASKNLNIVICNAYITTSNSLGDTAVSVPAVPDIVNPTSSPTNTPSNKLSNPIVLYTVGDSTTDWGSWRYKLVQRLQSSGYQVQTTGSKTDGYGLRHDGHASKRASDILSFMYSWMFQSYMQPRPSVITLLIGVNDLRGWRHPWSVSEDVKKIVGLMYQRQPDVRILLASTMKYNSQIWGGDSNQVSALNQNYISNVLNYYKNQGRKIDWVDLYNKVPADSIGDKLHPNIDNWGAQLMADAFFDALSPYL